MDTGEGVDLVYIDFPKAFDSVNHRILCDEMHVYGIHQTIVDWTRSFIFNRTFKIRVAVSIGPGSCMQRCASGFSPGPHPVSHLRL